MLHTTHDKQIHACQSGDPFADVGAAVLQRLLEQYPGWQPKDALTFATDVYLQNWQGKLDSFFQNSTITNAAFKGRQREMTLEYYERILEDETTSKAGWCRISGIYEPLFSGKRGTVILKLFRKWMG